MNQLEFVENVIIAMAKGNDEEVSYLEYAVRSAMTAGYYDSFVWRKEIHSATKMSFAASIPTSRPFVIELWVEWSGSDKTYRVIAVPQVVKDGVPEYLVEKVGPDHPLYEIVEQLHMQIMHWFRRRDR